MDSVSSSANRVVLKEMRRAGLKARALVSVVGMLIVGVVVILQESMGISSLQEPTIAASTALAVLLLGMASLMAWRGFGEYEFVERVEDRIVMRTTRAKSPVFDAPLETARLQRLSLPGGGTQLFLRDGVRAVELGSGMNPIELEGFQQQMESLMGKQALVR